jgi:hypothetical protein
VDVVEVELFDFGLLRVVLGLVLLLGKHHMSVKSVAVDGDHAISGNHDTLLSQNESINLNNVAVLLIEAPE